MGAAVAITRLDLTAGELRRAERKEKNGTVARRILAGAEPRCRSLTAVDNTRPTSIATPCLTSFRLRSLERWWQAGFDLLMVDERP
jgi:hypothetical protein